MENQKDSLSITENADGSFQMEWNKEDPKWSFLNNLTSKEIKIIVEKEKAEYLIDK